jgi:septum formation protein
MNRKQRLFLASQSPRRRELLEQMGIDYQVISVDIDEQQHQGELPAAYVTRVASEKAWAGWHAQSTVIKSPVLAADTSVVIGSQIMGKPVDESDAFEMLRRLSDRTHEVYSAVTLVDGETNVRISCSEVTFRLISDDEIRAYWQSGEPQDKAGGYAIQGLAAQFIDNLNGSYSGVMGLPLFETAELLYDAGYNLLEQFKGSEKR